MLVLNEGKDCDFRDYLIRKSMAWNSHWIWSLEIQVTACHNLCWTRWDKVAWLWVRERIYPWVFSWHRLLDSGSSCFFWLCGLEALLFVISLISVFPSCWPTELLFSVLFHCFVKSVLTHSGFSYFRGLWDTQNFSSFMVDFSLMRIFALLLVRHFSQQLGIYSFRSLLLSSRIQERLGFAMSLGQFKSLPPHCITELVLMKDFRQEHY